MSTVQDTGQSPTETVSQPPSTTKKSRCQCGWKCCAILPILIIVIVYNIPYLFAEYEGFVGYD